MSDYIVRATAADHQIRAFAATTKELVETARSLHNTSPVATAALGRLLTAGTMMGSMMKGDKDLLTLSIKCSGPIGGLMVTADQQGNVKGYVYHPEVMLPPNEKGKLNVGGALGDGILNVIKDMGLKEPYAGQTPLVSGEIAEDLTYYFAASEQVPSSVALGVQMERDNTVKQAGGFIIQLMPFAKAEVVGLLEQKISKITSVTALLEQGMAPEQMLTSILGEFGVVILERTPAKFYCNCEKERVKKAIISIGKKEISEIITEGKPIEVNCHFCSQSYTFTIEELKAILSAAK